MGKKREKKKHYQIIQCVSTYCIIYLNDKDTAQCAPQICVYQFPERSALPWIPSYTNTL